MIKTLTAAALAAATLAAPTAFAMDNPVAEARAKIERALASTESQPARGGQVSINRGEQERRTFDTRDLTPGSSWRDNYSAGRIHPPAGR